MEKPVLSFGTLWRGERLAHTFVVRNDGDSVLEIQEFRPACGCTVVEDRAVPRRLAPGESTELRLRIETGSLKGAVKKDIEILSNSAGGVERLVLEGEVKELLRLDPPAPVVEVIGGAPAPDAGLDLALAPAVEMADLRVVSLRAERGFLDVTLERGKLGEAVARLRATARARAASPGIETEELLVEVETARRSIELQLPVHVALRPRIVVRPRSSAYFRRADPRKMAAGGAAIERHLDVVSRGGPEHRFRIRSIRSERGFFRVRLQDTEPERRYRLTIGVDHLPGEGVRFVKDVIELETDDERVPRIRIPVRAQF